MSDVNIQISNDVVKGIIEKKLQTSIAAALVGEVQLLEAIVKTAISVKVDASGNIDRYGHSSNMDLIEWMCRDVIKKQTGKAIEDWVKAAEPKIKAEIEKQMRGQIKNIAASAVSSLVTSAGTGWNYKAVISVGQESK